MHVESALEFGNGPPYVHASGRIVRALNDEDGMVRARTSPRLTGVIHEADGQRAQHATMHEPTNPAAPRKVSGFNPRGCHGRSDGSKTTCNPGQKLRLTRRQRRQHFARRPPRHVNARCIHAHGFLLQFFFVVVHSFHQSVHFINHIGLDIESFVSSRHFL